MSLRVYTKTYTKENHNQLNHEWSRNGKACVASAKHRSKVLGLPYDIDWAYAISLMPKDMVDVFGGQMKWKELRDGKPTGSRDAPSIDRINPADGYIRGNIQWLTREHNLMKQNFTHEQLLAKMRCLLKNLQLLPI